MEVVVQRKFPKTMYADGGPEGGQHDGHVGGIGCNAISTRTKDRVPSIEAPDRGTSAARRALVAGMKGPIHEIRAARSLEQISSCRRHVAELRGSTAYDRLGEKRIVGPDDLVVCYPCCFAGQFSEERMYRTPGACEAPLMAASRPDVLTEPC